MTEYLLKDGVLIPLFDARRTVDGALQSVRFSVYGTPAPQGSKRHVGNGRMVESSAKVAPWREAVKAAITSETGGTVLFPTEAVSIVVDFHLARPKGHSGTGKNAGVLRAAAPMRPAGKPDLDKLLRSTFDGLGEAGMYGDDSQVVTVMARKLYVDTAFPVPGARLFIQPTARGLTDGFTS